MPRFNSINELENWLEENDLALNQLDIDAPEVCSESCDLSEDDELKITELTSDLFEVKSLIDAPSVALFENSEYNENIWIVDDFEFVENACGASRVTVRDSTLLLNVCESEGAAHVKLVCETDGKIEQVEFKLEKRCNIEEDYDMILCTQ